MVGDSGSGESGIGFPCSVRDAILREWVCLKRWKWAEGYVGWALMVPLFYCNIVLTSFLLPLRVVVPAMCVWMWKETWTGEHGRMLQEESMLFRWMLSNFNNLIWISFIVIINHFLFPFQCKGSITRAVLFHASHNIVEKKIANIFAFRYQVNNLTQ